MSIDKIAAELTKLEKELESLADGQECETIAQDIDTQAGAIMGIREELLIISEILAAQEKN